MLLHLVFWILQSVRRMMTLIQMGNFILYWNSSMKSSVVSSLIVALNQKKNTGTPQYSHSSLIILFTENYRSSLTKGSRNPVLVLLCSSVCHSSIIRVNNYRIAGNFCTVHISVFFMGMFVNVKIKTTTSELLNLKMAFYCYFKTVEQTSSRSLSSASFTAWQTIDLPLTSSHKEQTEIGFVIFCSGNGERLSYQAYKDSWTAVLKCHDRGKLQPGKCSQISWHLKSRCDT